MSAPDHCVFIGCSRPPLCVGNHGLVCAEHFRLTNGPAPSLRGMLDELVQVWDVMAAGDGSPIRAATRRECSDTLRMLLDVARRE